MCITRERSTATHLPRAICMRSIMRVEMQLQRCLPGGLPRAWYWVDMRFIAGRMLLVATAPLSRMNPKLVVWSERIGYGMGMKRFYADKVSNSQARNSSMIDMMGGMLVVFCLS